jgi:hypothetical protein
VLSVVFVDIVVNVNSEGFVGFVGFVVIANVAEFVELVVIAGNI